MNFVESEVGHVYVKAYWSMLVTWGDNAISVDQLLLTLDNDEKKCTDFILISVGSVTGHFCRCRLSFNVTVRSIKSYLVNI